MNYVNTIIRLFSFKRSIRRAYFYNISKYKSKCDNNNR